MKQLNVENLQILHCFQCGGTGRIYNNVPGSAFERSTKTHILGEGQCMSVACSLCNGTGHIVNEVE